MNPSIRSYIAEFIGTFTLVFVGTSVAVLQGMLDYGHTGWLGISLAFGFTLMVLVLVIGPVSGCHVNPAVTIPIALAGRMKWAEVPGYIIAQCLGAVVASTTLLALMKGFEVYSLDAHGLGANGNPHNAAVGTLFGLEVIMTALFLLTILSVTRPDAALGASKSPAFAGLAIGGFLFVAHLVGAPLGDASLNPARSLGPALFVGGGALQILWLYLLAPLAGGLLGYGLYRLIHAD